MNTEKEIYSGNDFCSIDFQVFLLDYFQKAHLLKTSSTPHSAKEVPSRSGLLVVPELRHLASAVTLQELHQ